MKNNYVSKGILYVVLITFALLAIPFLLMQFNVQFSDSGSSAGEVNWTPFDFILAGALLLGTGFTFVFTTKNMKTTKSRVVIAAAFLIALSAVWAFLATQ